MKVTPSLIVGGFAVISLALSSCTTDAEANSAAADDVATFEVDPFWPKPMPNHWLLGSAIGVGVDSRDHVFVIHRPESLNGRTEVGAASDPPSGECCLPAPNVLEFDPDGNLVSITES